MTLQFDVVLGCGFCFVVVGILWSFACCFDICLLTLVLFNVYLVLCVLFDFYSLGVAVICFGCVVRVA